MPVKNRDSNSTIGVLPIVALLVSLSYFFLVCDLAYGSSSDGEPFTYQILPDSFKQPRRMTRVVYRPDTTYLIALRDACVLATTEMDVELRVDRSIEVHRRLFPDSRMEASFIIPATVKAGFSLDSVGLGDIDCRRDEHGRLFVDVALPEPEVISVDIDYETVYSDYVEHHWPGSGEAVVDIQLEALATAKDTLAYMAVEDGILEEARLHGKVAVEDILVSLGAYGVSVEIEEAENEGDIGQEGGTER